MVSIGAKLQEHQNGYPIATFSTVVMRIKKGKSVFFSLILDHGQGGWKALSIVADDAVYVARFETSLNQQRQGTVKTLIRSSDDSFTVELADTIFSFRGIGFLEVMKHSITVFRK